MLVRIMTNARIQSKDNSERHFHEIIKKLSNLRDKFYYVLKLVKSYVAALCTWMKNLVGKATKQK